jgi:hypothetical protein
MGDVDAAERLYWSLHRSADHVTLMDRLIEAAICTETKKRSATIWQKLAFMRGESVMDSSPQQVERAQQEWSVIVEAGQLHRIPREVRQPGFTTYCQQDTSVYRYGPDRQWKRLVRLSAAPPGRPFHVVDTLAERDALDVRSGASCLVLANRGIYRSQIRKNDFSESETVHWQSIRFEAGAV